MEKYSCYHFEVTYEYGEDWKGWCYTIFTESPFEFLRYRESEDFFETEQEARFAAIGHIDLLENGEG